MTIWLVVWVVLMILWLFGGSYLTWDANNPRALGGTLLPWVCVLILGLAVFGAFDARPIVIR